MTAQKKESLERIDLGSCPLTGDLDALPQANMTQPPFFPAEREALGALLEQVGGPRHNPLILRLDVERVMVAKGISSNRDSSCKGFRIVKVPPGRSIKKDRQFPRRCRGDDISKFVP